MNQTRAIDYYEVLGITQDATLKEINGAYKKLALKHHPDKDDGSSVEFIKIQQAVETLRDPVRRQKHDDELVSCIKCDEFEFPPGYTGWRPYDSFRDARYMSRYMFSYGNSVHMDPHSAASRKEKAWWENARRFEDEVLSPPPSPVQESWEFDEVDIDPALQQDEDAWFAAEKGPGNWEKLASENGRRNEMAAEKEKEKEDKYREDYEEDYYEDYYYEEYDEDYEDENEEAQQQACPLEHAEQEEEDLIDLSSEYETANQTKGDSPFGPSSTSNVEEQDSEAGDTGVKLKPTGTDDDNADLVTLFYETKSVQSVSPRKSYKQLETTTTTTTTNVEPKLPPPSQIYATNLENANPHLAPFIPYLESKLHHPSNRYVAEDVQTELKGIVLESYCGWLESVRLSFSDSKPLRQRIDAEECSHLGYWAKDFESPECEACGRWMPIFVLTCPGCGIRRCAGCKFDGWGKKPREEVLVDVQ